jgi:hypothetical protein
MIARGNDELPPHSGGLRIVVVIVVVVVKIIDRIFLGKRIIKRKAFLRQLKGL